MTDTRDVRLPSDLCAAAEARFGDRFGTLEEFLAFVLRELLRHESAKAEEAEQRLVEERLRDLGYL
jgi:hypothetical protein